MFIASEFRFGGCRFKPDSVPWNSRYSIYCIPLARPFVIAFIVFPRPLQFFVSMLSPRQSPAPLFWIADAVGLGTGCRNMIGHWVATLLKSWVNAPTLSKCLIAKKYICILITDRKCKRVKHHLTWVADRSNIVEPTNVHSCPIHTSCYGQLRQLCDLYGLYRSLKM